MTHPKGKLVAIAAAVVGICTLGVAGFILRVRIQEEYYIWKLSSLGLDDVERAAERLGEMRSARAVPALLECWIRISEEAEAKGLVRKTEKGCLRHLPFDTVPIEIPWRIMNAITSLGRSALPPLSKAFDRGDLWRRTVFGFLIMISLPEGGGPEVFLVRVKMEAKRGSTIHQSAIDLLKKFDRCDEERVPFRGNWTSGK